MNEHPAWEGIGWVILPVALLIVFAATRSASADTHAERCDVKQAQPARVGSAVAANSSETPNLSAEGDS